MQTSIRRNITAFLLLTIPFLFVNAQLYFNEIVASNSELLSDEDYGNSTDLLEIFNNSDKNINLTGYTLTDDKSVPDKWIFPTGYTIKAKAFLLIWADNKDTLLTELHTNFKLSASGEYIGLYDENGNILDTLTYPQLEADISFARDKDGDGAWKIFNTPTPGTSNSAQTASIISSSPEFSHTDGFYEGSFNLKLSAAEEANIYYTIDGSQPSVNSLNYSYPIVIGSTKVVKAIAVEPGRQASLEKVNTYFINETTMFSVVSLSTDPENLWSNNKGIYVVGTNGKPGPCGMVANWSQDWEIPVYIEYFDSSGKNQISNHFGAKIFGGCSRDMDEKSLSIYARDEYGDDEIDYNVFSHKNLDYIKSMVLRNSGNDFQYTMFRDEFMQYAIATQMDIDWQDFQPSLVFFNGEYWGIHNIREKLNEHYVEGNYNIDNDNVDFIEGESDVKNGSKKDYQDLLHFMGSHDLSDDLNYEVVTRQIDVDEYMNYQIAQIYIDNTDWPGNNIKYWKENTDAGKWRWIIYDTDFGFSLYSSSYPEHNTLEFALEPNNNSWPNPAWSTFFFRHMMENETFRYEFVQRFAAHVYTTFQPKRITAMIDSFSHVYQPEIERHMQRWNTGNIDSWYRNITIMKEFGEQRPDLIMNHFKNYFGLSGISTLEVNNKNTDKGEVLINGVNVGTTFKGKFVHDIPIRITAKLKDSYRISHWQLNTTEYTEKEIMPKNSTWKYFDKGYLPADNWNSLDYDDSAWDSGAGELGYGDGGEATEISFGTNSGNKYSAYYFRKEITVKNATKYKTLTLQILRDDGIVVYINGNEVARENMSPGVNTYESLATNYVGDNDEQTYFEYQIMSPNLQEGKNIISVEVHQSSVTSTDISFDMSIEGFATESTFSDSKFGNEIFLPLTENMEIIPVFERIDKPAALLINEILAANSKTISDENGQKEDYIEIYNPSDFAIDLGGMYITDDLALPEKFMIADTLPEKTTIQPGGFYLLWADDDAKQGVNHIGFKLNKDKGEIGLGWDGSTFIDSKQYANQETDISFGRYRDGEDSWELFNIKTPGFENIHSPDKPSINISEKAEDNNIQIYPNPTIDILKVDVNNEIIENIDMLNLTGKLLSSYTGNDIHEIDISDYVKGIYVLKIKTNSNIYIRKIIKN